MTDEQPDMEDLLEVAGKQTCGHEHLEDLVAAAFEYSGSCLGTFTVPNASLKRCQDCATLFYSRAESKRWQLAKAIQIVSNDTPLRASEIKFIRELAGLTITELARILRIDKGTLSRWESDGPRNEAAGRADLVLRAFFVVSLWQADMKEFTSREFTPDSLQQLAGLRVSLIEAALPGMKLANVKSITASLQTDLNLSEDQLLVDDG